MQCDGEVSLRLRDGRELPAQPGRRRVGADRGGGFGRSSELLPQ
jgi:hypothetical protein